MTIAACVRHTRRRSWQMRWSWVAVTAKKAVFLTQDKPISACQCKTSTTRQTSRVVTSALRPYRRGTQTISSSMTSQATCQQCLSIKRLLKPVAKFRWLTYAIQTLTRVFRWSETRRWSRMNTDSSTGVSTMCVATLKTWFLAIFLGFKKTRAFIYKGKSDKWAWKRPDTKRSSLCWRSKKCGSVAFTTFSPAVSAWWLVCQSCIWCCWRP